MAKKLTDFLTGVDDEGMRDTVEGIVKQGMVDSVTMYVMFYGAERAGKLLTGFVETCERFAREDQEQDAKKKAA